MRLSIITINYNNLAGLRKTLDSIHPLAKEVNCQIEHIIIDGGSSDGSKELIEDYSNNYKLIWLSEKDSGIFNAMNKGLDASSGEFIVFMNSGDSFVQGILTESYLNSFNNFDLIYGDIITESNFKLVPLKQTSSLDFLYFIGRTICHQSVVLKRSLLLQYKFKEVEEFNLIGDWIQLFSILRAEKIKILKLKQEICIYNIEGISEQQSELRKFQRQKYLEFIYSDWELSQLEMLHRLRTRDYFNLFFQSLDNYKIQFILKKINKWINH
jgi:glycosyltransferase involved in cell wall biosynthesis